MSAYRIPAERPTAPRASAAKTAVRGFIFLCFAPLFLFMGIIIFMGVCCEVIATVAKTLIEWVTDDGKTLGEAWNENGHNLRALNGEIVEVCRRPISLFGKPTEE